jgi:hypothetical protein
MSAVFRNQIVAKYSACAADKVSSAAFGAPLVADICFAGFVFRYTEQKPIETIVQARCSTCPPHYPELMRLTAIRKLQDWPGKLFF